MRAFVRSCASTSPQADAMIMALGTHLSGASNIIVPDHQPAVPVRSYLDGLGNWCCRIVAPDGPMRLAADGFCETAASLTLCLPLPATRDRRLACRHTGLLARQAPLRARQISEKAWKLFEATPPGWPRVQAICNFVHRHIAFGSEHARATMTAREVFSMKARVCAGHAAALGGR